MQKRRALIIAIDGPAASGKSTTAQRVATELGYTYIDTGAMYRGVTLAVLRAGLDPADGAEVCELANGLTLTFVQSEGDQPDRTLLNGEDVSDAIRQPAVSKHVSQVSAYAPVRRRMVELQREMSGVGGVVLDGRDIGTVVFPHADLKIFLVADIESRARRRWTDLMKSGFQVEELAVAEDLKRRDRKDSSREESPLKPATDAIEIDTSRLSIDEQVEMVVKLARERMDNIQHSDAESP